jgi:RNA polymerase sigma-70 factor (sigma-E family)
MTIPQQRVGAGQPALRPRGVASMMTAAQDRGVTYDEFFKTEYPRLVPMLRALTADRQRAEDIAQEALWRAQRHWERISTYERPGAWVRRVALNASANVRRSRQREERALARVAGTSGPAGPGSAEGWTEGDDELWVLVRNLPEQQRFAIVLHYVADRSVADIAEVLECSEGTVKTHLSRGRATLARGLASAGTEVGHD